MCIGPRKGKGQHSVAGLKVRVAAEFSGVYPVGNAAIGSRARPPALPPSPTSHWPVLELYTQTRSHNRAAAAEVRGFPTWWQAKLCWSSDIQTMTQTAGLLGLRMRGQRSNWFTGKPVNKLIISTWEKTFSLVGHNKFWHVTERAEQHKMDGEGKNITKLYTKLHYSVCKAPLYELTVKMLKEMIKYGSCLNFFTLISFLQVK